MNPWRPTLLTLLLSAASAAGAVVGSFDDITFWVGSGTNRAALVIDWNDGKNLSGSAAGESLAWGFRWNDGDAPTGMTMLKAVAAADPRLDLNIVVRNLGETVFGLYYDLDGDGGTPTYDPISELGSADDTADHFAEGWRFNGYWTYFTGASGQTVPTWAYSGTGAQSRSLTNNAWDGWSFDDFSTNPGPKPDLAAAALPEPGSGLLVALGALILLRRK